jgi:hypothetical protein
MEETVETYSTYDLIDESRLTRKDWLEAQQSLREAIADSVKLMAELQRERGEPH